MKVLKGLTAVVFLAATLLSSSRTAFLAVLAGASWLAWQRWKHQLQPRVIRYLPLLLVVVLPMLMWALCRHRPDSANGRLFIWQRSLELGLRNPFFGLGTGKFQPAYMEAQADYFQSHPEDHAAMRLADNVHHPFNEWIGLWTVRAPAAVLYHLFRASRQANERS